jgi:hypothetical protein
MKTAKKKQSPRRRNAAPSAPPRPATRRRRIPLPPIPDPPDWKTTAASVLGGGGSALLGGYLANRGWDSQMVGLAMTTGGAVGAFALPGPWRVAANGVAAAGAGQLALATMHKTAVNKAVKDAVAVATPKRNALPSAFGNALSGAMHDYSGGSYAGSLDDEERMIDPDLVLGAA